MDRDLTVNEQHELRVLELVEERDGLPSVVWPRNLRLPWAWPMR